MVGLPYVSMAGRSLGARSVVGLPYVSMAGGSIAARSVVGLAYVSMAGRSFGARSAELAGPKVLHKGIFVKLCLL